MKHQTCVLEQIQRIDVIDFQPAGIPQSEFPPRKVDIFGPKLRFSPRKIDIFDYLALLDISFALKKQ